MRIYQLTKVGDSFARTPTNNMTHGWKIIYFLRRHGGRATDDQIVSFTGLDEGEVREAMRKLTSGKNPAVNVVSG